MSDEDLSGESFAFFRWVALTHERFEWLNKEWAPHGWGCGLCRAEWLAMNPHKRGIANES